MCDSSQPSSKLQTAAPNATQELGLQTARAWAHDIRAVAFDMDGLLVNTEELYTEVGHTILSRRGKQFTSKLKNAMTGLPGPKAFALMIAHEQLSDSVEALAAESAEIFGQILAARVKTMLGVEAMLDLLDSQKLPRCVATSSTRQFADEVLQIVGIADRVDFVVTSENVQHGKPAPDIYLLAAERMQVSPRNMLVFEDSHHGSTAGVASGACTIAVPGPHSEDHDFSRVHYRATSLADPNILQFFKRTTLASLCLVLGAWLIVLRSALFV
ncbi:MAG: HAD family phosphatase [Pirellulaceae bacterium]